MTRLLIDCRMDARFLQRNCARFLRIAPWYAFVLVLFANYAYGQPAITHSLPMAVAPGKTIDLTIHGQKLDDPVSVWTSFPAKVEILPPAEAKPGQTQRICKITLDPTVSVGVGGLILSTPEGASDMLLLMVDDLPSVADNGQNQALAQAQEVPVPTAVDGVSDGTKFDYYKFNVAAGQRVSVEVVAGRIGQDFDPVLRLLDATGKELRAVDDDFSVGSDCRISHTFAAAGQYVLEVRDNQYRAGSRYRLRIGDFPLVSSAYPLGGQTGTTGKFSFAGPAVEGIVPVDVAVGATVAGGRLPVSVRFPGGVSSGWANIAVNGSPESLEVEPNNDPGNATSIVVPCGINGRLEVPGDRDVFQFEAKKGQRLSFRAGSRSFGSPALVKMYIQKADGAGLAESPVSESDEETLVFAFPEDGSYRLAVEDLLKRGAPDFVYRVSIDPAPLFSLSLKPDKATRHKFVAGKSGSFAIDVQCVRSGYDGPITLSVDGPAGTFQTFNNVIPDKQAAAKMIVIPPAEYAPGQFAALRITGKATVDGQEKVSVASTTDLVRVLRPALNYPPAWMDGLVSLSTATEQPAFYTAVPDRAVVVVPRTAAPQAEFNLKFERKNDQFKDPLQVTFPAAPAGFSFEVKRNGNGPMETYQVIVKGPKDLPEGSQTVRVVSYAELAGKGQTIVADLPFQVTTPLAVTLAPAGGLIFGNTQKLKVAVTRFAGEGADKQPVVVKWKKLPPGVTAPPEITIPADQTEAVVDLTAAADAPAGAFNELAVVASTKFQGQDVTTESAPLNTEVRK